MRVCVCMCGCVSEGVLEFAIARKHGSDSLDDFGSAVATVKSSHEQGYARLSWCSSQILYPICLMCEVWIAISLER